MKFDGTPLVIAGKAYRSRLLVGNDKYRDLEETRLTTEASGAEIITVAERRSNIAQNLDEPNLRDAVPPTSRPFCPILLTVITPTMPCVPVVWHVNY